MATYYIDDGGDGTTENSWATADTSMKDLDTEYAFASGDIIFIGHNSICQAVHTGSLTVTFPASGLPVKIISATQGSSPETFQASSTNQIEVTENTSYELTLDGSVALYGTCMAAGSHIKLSSDSNESIFASECTFKPGANAGFQLLAGGGYVLQDTTIDLTADGTTNRSAVPITLLGQCTVEIQDMTFVNAAYRTGSVFHVSGNGGVARISGVDLSGFTNATACEILTASGAGFVFVMNNCLTAATWTPLSGTMPAGAEYWISNTGPASDPTYLYFQNYFGGVVSSSSIYRTGGLTINSVNVSWLVTTNAVCSETAPFCTPWIYGSIGSTGSKTFDVFITNDTADFTDAEVWLEIEYLGTASEAISSLANDQRADITTTAVAQTDDVSSTWNGSGPSFTYKQKLSITATVNVAGMFRARVCVGLASIASSRFFYIDPLVTVS